METKARFIYPLCRGLLDTNGRPSPFFCQQGWHYQSWNGNPTFAHVRYSLTIPFRFVLFPLTFWLYLPKDNEPLELYQLWRPMLSSYCPIDFTFDIPICYIVCLVHLLVTSNFALRALIKKSELAPHECVYQ